MSEDDGGFEEQRVFYGWRMVGVAFFSHLVAAGLGFYALPRLLVPLANEFAGGERAGVALLLPAMSLPGVIVSPLIGRAVGRFPLRRVLAAGALVLAIGFALASQVNSLWQLLCVYAITVPVGVAAMSNIGANALVTNWFDRRRPLALGISQFGLSISGALIAFFIGWTLSQGGWRGTYLWFSAIALVTGPLLWVSITDRPSEKGLHPDGDHRDVAPVVEAEDKPKPMKFGVAMRDPTLWLVGIAAGLCFSGITAMLQNMHAFTTDAGHSLGQADVVLATIAVGAAFGKILFGLLGVRFGERVAFLIAALGEGLGLALLPAASSSITLLVPLALFFGLTLGGVLPAMGALLARIYGAEQFGPVIGYVGLMLVPLQMVGAPIAAWVYDQTGNYDAAIYGFVAASAVAVLALMAIRLRSDTA